VLATVLVSSGIRPCEARALRPQDFDFDAGVIKVERSIVSVSREHHPEGKTFLIRDYTKNGTTRRVPVDNGCMKIVKEYTVRHGFARDEIIFPAEMLVPPRPNKDTLTEAEMAALGYCEPVGGQVYKHGTMGAYTPGRSAGARAAGSGLAGTPASGCAQRAGGAGGRSPATPTSPI
jgi:integrase